MHVSLRQYPVAPCSHCAHRDGSEGDGSALRLAQHVVCRLPVVTHGGVGRVRLAFPSGAPWERPDKRDAPIRSARPARCDDLHFGRRR